MKIAVITITCNRLELTKKYLSELKDKNNTKFEHIIVDNGSTDGTVEWLFENDYTVIRLSKNVGVYKALKIGIKYVKDNINPDYIIKYDDDCELQTFGILDEIMRFYKKGCKDYVIAPLDVNILETHMPKTYTTQTERGHSVRYVTHVGGIFVVSQQRLWYDMIKMDDELVCEDSLRGRFWRSKFQSIVYLEDLKINHKGLFKSVDNYKLLNKVIKRPK